MPFSVVEQQLQIQVGKQIEKSIYDRVLGKVLEQLHADVFNDPMYIEPLSEFRVSAHVKLYHDERVMDSDRFKNAMKELTEIAMRRSKEN